MMMILRNIFIMVTNGKKTYFQKLYSVKYITEKSLIDERWVGSSLRLFQISRQQVSF